MSHPPRPPWRALRPVLLALLLCWAAPAPAQEAKDITFKFSARAKDEPVKTLTLRPNVEQKWFVHATNQTDKEKTFTVQLVYSDAEGKLKAVEPAKSRKLTLKGGATGLVEFGPPAEKAPEEKAPPKPPGKGEPPAKAEAPALAEAKGEGELRLVAIDDANKVLGRSAILDWVAPSSYVDVALGFEPTTKDEKVKNRLTVSAKNMPDVKYAGPKIEVVLVLDPDRIPGLVPGRADGTRSGWLTPTGTLPLKAENLEFGDVGAALNGWVYVTVDGYKRAFTYRTTFFRDGATPGTPKVPQEPIMRLIAPAVASPDQPLPVKLEVDNTQPGDIVELGFDRDGDGKFDPANDEIIEVKGDRAMSLFVGASAADGGLLLQPKVADHVVPVDVGQVNGRRMLRLRLMRDGKPVKIINSAVGYPAVEEILQPVSLSNIKPGKVDLFVNLEKIGERYQLAKGALLPVAATGVDPDAGIKKVVFFVGKLMDGKVPPTAKEVEGTFVPGDPMAMEERLKQGYWKANLAAPTGMVGAFDVTVVVTNAVGLSEPKTVTIELVDPGAGGAVPGVKKFGIIRGVVVMGDIPQQGAVVTLRDAEGKIKAATATFDAIAVAEAAARKPPVRRVLGGYEFRDVPPGTYRVDAVKKGDYLTRGRGAATISEGQPDPAEVNIKVTR
jgi:hypothetical protein